MGPEEVPLDDGVAIPTGVAPPGGAQRQDRRLWIGFGLVAVGSLVAFFAEGRPLIQQFATRHRLITSAAVGNAVVAGVVIGLMAVAALWRRRWVRILGLGAASAVAALHLDVVIVGRLDEFFVPGFEVSLAAGAWIYLAAAVLDLIGVGAVVSALLDQPVDVGVDRWAKRGVWALLLGLLAAPLAAITGPAALVVGVLSNRSRKSLGQRRGALASAGVVIAVLSIAGWLTAGTVAAFTATP